MKQLLTLLVLSLSLFVSNAQTKMNEKKILVAYFSATGTTKAQAKAIATATNATLYEITPAVLYTAADLDWNNKKSRSTIEMADGKSRPALGGESIDASSYDIIFIGYPIWWYVCPTIVNTWIESQNLKGKTVIPFATSGSSTIDNSVKVLRNLYPDIKWEDGKLLNCPAERAAAWGKLVVG